MNKKLFVILGLSLLLAGGVFWCTMKRQKESVVVPVRQGEVKTYESVKGEEGYVWFPVPELGIEIKVKKDIASELMYQTKEVITPDRAPFTSAQFTTKGLFDIARKLYQKEFEEDGNYVCGLGSFSTYQSMPVDFDTNEIYEYTKAHGVKVNEGFVSYDSPQSTCSSNSSDEKYWNYVANWWGAPTSEYTETNNLLQNLQKAVRKIE